MSLRQEYAAAIIAAGNKRSTLDAYWPHVCSFITFVRKRKGPRANRNDVDVSDVYDYRTHLAFQMRLSPKSRNQAMAAIRFLFVRVIGKPIDEREGDPLNARTPNRRRRKSLPKSALVKFFDHLPTIPRLIAQMQYAGVMRLDDVVNLRWKDLNFEQEQIAIASCKHDHFRIVPFPRSIHAAVLAQRDRVQSLHRFDIRRGYYGVPVPNAYARKSPSAPHDFGWYWLFPSRNQSIDPSDGIRKRYRRDKDALRKVYKEAKRSAGIDQTLTPHDLRRNAATHLHLAGMPLKRLQDILGHARLEQTRQYILDDESEVNGSMSPFDELMRSAG